MFSVLELDKSLNQISEQGSDERPGT